MARSDVQPAALISCEFLDRMGALTLLLKPLNLILLVCSGGLDQPLRELGQFGGSVLAIIYGLLLLLTAVGSVVAMLLFWFGVAIKLLWGRQWIWLIFVVLTNLLRALIAHLAL